MTMTLQELYQSIDGDYDQAMRVLRIERLLDKHIRKFLQNSVVERLLAAGRTKDAREMFESAHAMKGICGNLGLKDLCDIASELSEEFRPGNPRKMSDEEVDRLLAVVDEKYKKTMDQIGRYAEGK